MELNDIEDLYNAVQMLHNGRIPYRFVSHAKLREGLHVLNGQLRLHHSELVVAIEDLIIITKVLIFMFSAIVDI